jgi:hypothetical protein
MINNISYHDACITGLLYRESKTQLVMQAILSDERKILLHFHDVAGWDLSPFEEQNILFDLSTYDHSTLPDWIKTDFEIPSEYLELLDTREKNLFYLEPSIGLGGYIIARIMKPSEKNRDELG